MGLRADVAQKLEEGMFDGPLARVVSRAWETFAARSVRRPLTWPESLRVVAVGGATLGGSAKTPVAIACVENILRAGAARRVALVGHAYRARPGRPRVVSPTDPAHLVGDEALLSARQLAAFAGAVVVVGATRSAALALAAELADVAVLDGVAQTTPQRAHLALLAVDRIAPWGAGGCPPRGDLRAPIPSLLASADAVVAVGEDGAPWLGGDPGCPVHLVDIKSEGAWLGPRWLPWSTLRGQRVGLSTALARPKRVRRLLELHGVHPVAEVRSEDHGTSSDAGEAAIAAVRSSGVELWLATPKCRIVLGAELGGKPVAALDHSLALRPGMVAELLRAVTIAA